MNVKVLDKQKIKRKVLKIIKIKKINYNQIIFDNGNYIDYGHSQDCCEDNYADFSQIEDLALQTEFDKKLDFEFIDGAGFKFGNKPSKMFFIPCYSEQNGYYTRNLDIYCNKHINNFEAKFVDC